MRRRARTGAGGRFLCWALGRESPPCHVTEVSLTYLDALHYLLTPGSHEEAGALTFEAVPRPSILTADNRSRILAAIPREAVGAKADLPCPGSSIQADHCKRQSQDLVHIGVACHNLTCSGCYCPSLLSFFICLPNFPRWFLTI